MTVAVCTVSQLDGDADETVNTLMYATRMASIQNNPVPRVEPQQVSSDDLEVSQMTNKMTIHDHEDKDLRSVSSNLGRIPR